MVQGNMLPDNLVSVINKGSAIRFQGTASWKVNGKPRRAGKAQRPCYPTTHILADSFSVPFSIGRFSNMPCGFTQLIFLPYATSSLSNQRYVCKAYVLARKLQTISSRSGIINPCP
jgi:hypothetical protein